jgi:protein-S-isoprenylcysteine O-methyltransferase Ste14
MDRAFLEIIFLCGMILQLFLLWPFIQDHLTRKRRIKFIRKERQFLSYAMTGFLILPVIYVFSTWFSFFDYHLPEWFGFFSTTLYSFALWLFFRSFSDLGSYWSPGLEIKEDHKLITSGVFKWVRHPMYASYAVMAVSQIFMLQNWLVGPASLLLAVPFYLYRVKREESQLISYFGDDYRTYRSRTNAMIPGMDQPEVQQMLQKLKFLKKDKG